MLRTGLPAILKQRLKLIPFTHVNFSPEFNILCEREFGSSKKKISIPTFLGSPPPKINPYLIQIFVALKPPTKFFLRLALCPPPPPPWGDIVFGSIVSIIRVIPCELDNF